MFPSLEQLHYQDYDWLKFDNLIGWNVVKPYLKDKNTSWMHSGSAVLQDLMKNAVSDVILQRLVAILQ